MHALLLEPDADVRQLLRQVLERRGWSVRSADGADAAIRAFQEEAFSLVVVGFDGGAGAAEVCRAVRSSRVGRATFVLAVTAQGGPDEVRRLAGCGADQFLVAPLDEARVEAALAFAEGHIHLQPAEPRAGARGASYPQRIRELEEALQVQQAALEELFNSAPEGVAIVDEKDRVRRVNGEFTRMFGYTATEALGRQINDLIIPEELWGEGMRLTQGVIQGERIQVDTVRRRRDGTLVDVSVLATPIQVADGPIGAYGIYRDITERKASERALRESEARYRALFDQSPVGVFLCDAELRVTRCNAQLPRIVRSSVDEIVGVDLTRTKDPRLLPMLREMEAGRPATYEGPFQALHGGEEIWISLRWAPLRDPEGRIFGGVGVVEDVTERERAGQQLRAQAAELERVNEALHERTQELEAALQTRSRLYSSINHELRTPLSAIMLHQELLLSGALGELAPDQSEALERANTAASHLLDLVVDVLDLSKLEAGRVTITPVPTSLRAMLSDLHATARPLVRRYGSELHLDLGEGPDEVVTDPQRVRQVLLNLLSNAAKFGCGEPVWLRRRDGEPGEVRLEVVDRGIGISEEDMPLIFDDFVQVGKIQEGGTGLGLAISKRLAGLLGGRLEVESLLGAGSTFRLVLPYTHPGGGAAHG